MADLTVKSLNIPNKKMLIITTSGEEKEIDFTTGPWGKLIGADTLDFVSIGKCLPSYETNADLVMAVDDSGYKYELIQRGSNTFESVPKEALKPFNEKATKLYLDICIPGTDYKIVGDVLIMHDTDVETSDLI